MVIVLWRHFTAKGRLQIINQSEGLQGFRRKILLLISIRRMLAESIQWCQKVPPLVSKGNLWRMNIRAGFMTRAIHRYSSPAHNQRDGIKKQVRARAITITVIL